MDLSRQEYWSGLPFPSPGDLPHPGTEPGSPTLQAYSLTSEPPGKSQLVVSAMKYWTYFTGSYGAGGSDGKACVYNAGDPGSIPGLGRSPGEGNGNPLQDYCLENPMDRGA